MNTTRRDFLESSAACTALGLAGLPGFEQSAEQAPGPSAGRRLKPESEAEVLAAWHERYDGE